MTLVKNVHVDFNMQSYRMLDLTKLFIKLIHVSKNKRKKNLLISKHIAMVRICIHAQDNMFLYI